MADCLQFVIWGSAGHARVLASLIARQGATVVAFFDNDANASPAIKGAPLFIGEDGFKRWCQRQEDLRAFCGLVAVGGARGNERLLIQSAFRAAGLHIPSIVHPDASVCATAHLGAGTQVLAGAVIATDVRLGEACIVNHRASVDHECMLGDGVHIAPGSTLCGCVRIGDNVMIGAGAVVLPRITIGTGTIVGAGAIVTRDLPAGVVAVGNPARTRRASICSRSLPPINRTR